jgi:Uma2 family endonuclease
MSTALSPPPPPAEADIGIEDVARISIEAWHEMIGTGRFDERDPYELLEGLIVKKMPEDPLHTAVVYALKDLLGERLPAGFIVRGPGPVTSDSSEPEPDLCVARGEQLDYVSHHPRPEDIVLLIEVANTSLARDRTWKRRIYARAGTPAYWIVNLRDRTIEAFAEPEIPEEGDPRYVSGRIYAEDEPIELPLPGVPALKLADVLPPAG